MLFVFNTVFYVCSVDVWETDHDAYTLVSVFDNVRGAVDAHRVAVDNPVFETCGYDTNGTPFDHAYYNTPRGVTRYATWDDVLTAFPDDPSFSFNRYDGPLFPPTR